MRRIAKIEWAVSGIVLLLVVASCGTLDIQGQVLYPDQATATRLAADTGPSTATATPVAANLSPVTFPTPQACTVPFFWGAMPGLCPGAGPTQVDAAFQVYDRGYMLWEHATGRVYILYNGGLGRQFAESTVAQWPEVEIQTAPPPNHVHPIRGFGRVWQHENDVRNSIGWPLGLEQAYTAQFQSADSESGQTDYYISLPNSQVVEFNGAGTWRVVK